MGLDMYLFGIKKNKDGSTGKWEEVCYWRKANQIHKWFATKFIKRQNPWGHYRIEESDLQGLLLICKLLKYLKENSDDQIFEYINTELSENLKDKFTYWLDDEDYQNDYADLIAMAILPPDNMGCCFGSGIISDWYWEDIDDTIDQLTKVLKENYNHYFYTASW